MNPEYARLRALGYKSHAELEADLAAGQIENIGYEEVVKANDLIRAAFPLDIRYPREGDVYVAKEDTEVSYLTTWELPYTGGGKGILPKFEKVRVLELGHDQPVAVGCQALDYQKIERLLIPEADRTAGKYSGYYLSIGTLELHEKFELVGREAP